MVCKFRGFGIQGRIGPVWGLCRACHGACRRFDTLSAVSGAAILSGLFFLRRWSPGVFGLKRTMSKAWLYFST